MYKCQLDQSCKPCSSSRFAIQASEVTLSNTVNSSVSSLSLLTSAELLFFGEKNGWYFELSKNRFLHVCGWWPDRSEGKYGLRAHSKTFLFLSSLSVFSKKRLGNQCKSKRHIVSNPDPTPTPTPPLWNKSLRQMLTLITAAQLLLHQMYRRSLNPSLDLRSLQHFPYKAPLGCNWPCATPLFSSHECQGDLPAQLFRCLSWLWVLSAASSTAIHFMPCSCLRPITYHLSTSHCWL